jgi:hypothetical protein
MLIVDQLGICEPLDFHSEFLLLVRMYLTGISSSNLAYFHSSQRPICLSSIEHLKFACLRKIGIDILLEIFDPLK